MIVHARPGQYSAGESIGILLLDAMLPLPPGDVAHAGTYPFPVRYQVVKAASIDRLIYQRDPALLAPFIEGGLALASQGVKAITSDCGFMALFQQEMTEALPVPVFLTSLLQVPMMQAMLPPDQSVGIISADAGKLTEAHLKAAGITQTDRIRLAGMENSPHFTAAILQEKGLLDTEAVEAEAVHVAQELVVRHPEIGALLLECSNLPPYAAAIQQAVQLPVFDFNTMIHHVHSALNRRRYT